MADTIEFILRVQQQQAVAALQSAASAADGLATAQAQAAKTGEGLSGAAEDVAEAAKAEADALEEAARAAEAAAKAGADKGGQRPQGGGPTPPRTPTPDLPPTPPIPNPREVDDSANAIKNLSGRVMTLRYNLMDVGQQLAGGANPFMVLLQQGPEIAGALGDATEAAEVLKASFGGIITKLAPVAGMLAGIAVAAAALATAMIVLKNATTDADEAQGGLSARLESTGIAAATAQEKIDDVRKAIGALRASNKDAEIGLMELTGQIDKYEAAAKRSQIALDDEVESKRRDIALTIEQQKAHIAAVDAKIKNISILNSLTEAELEEAQMSRQTATEKLAAAEADRATLEDLYTSRQRIIASTEEYGRALAEEEEKERKANKARSEAKQHLSELKAKYDDLVKVLDAFQDRERLESALSIPADLIPAAAIQSARDLEAAINKIAPPKDVLNDYQRLTMLLDDAQRLAASNPGLQGWADDLSAQVTSALDDGTAQGMAGLAKDFEGLAKTFGAMVAAQIQRGARIGASVGDVLGGDIAGGIAKAIPALGAKFADAFAGRDGLLGKAAAIAGPLSAGFGAAIGGLQDLGTQGARATSRSLMSGVDAITKGIGNLPALIRRFIPELIVALITELIPALVAAVPRLLVTILIELPVAIVRGLVTWWREIGGLRGIAGSIADGVRQWWTSTWDRLRDWLRDIFTPGDQGRGRRVSETRAAELRELQAQAMAATSPRGRPGQPTDARTGQSRTRGPQPMAARPAPSVVVQAGSIHPDMVPSILRDIDRMTRPGGLRRGTTVLGGT